MIAKIAKQLSLVLSGVLIGGFAVGVWMQLHPITAEPATELLGATTETVPCEEIKIHVAKKKKRKDLGLSKEVQKDKDLHLVNATRIEADGHDYVISALYSSNNQRVDLFTAQQPLPWLSLAPKRNTFVSYHYGIKTDEGTVGRLTAGWTFLQVKALRVNLIAQGDTDGQAFGGVGVIWEF